MIQGGIWLASAFVDAENVDVWICNRCRAVVRDTKYECPRCHQQMVATLSAGGLIVQIDDAVLQLGDDARIE